MLGLGTIAQQISTSSPQNLSVASVSLSVGMIACASIPFASTGNTGSGSINGKRVYTLVRDIKALFFVSWN